MVQHCEEMRVGFPVNAHEGLVPSCVLGGLAGGAVDRAADVLADAAVDGVGGGVGRGGGSVVAWGGRGQGEYTMCVLIMG